MMIQLLLMFAMLTVCLSGCGGPSLVGMDSNGQLQPGISRSSVESVPITDCGTTPRTAAVDSAVGTTNVFRSSRPADEKAGPAYANCNYPEGLDKADLRWTYNASLPSTTTLRFYYEKCQPDTAEPLNAEKCLPQPGITGICAKAPEVSSGRYEKTINGVAADAEENVTWRIRPVYNAGGTFKYGSWIRSNTLGPYNFKIPAPELSLQDYRSKVPWFATLLSAFANIKIPGINILNNINLDPVRGEFNKGTLFVKSNDVRTGYILLALPGQPSEQNGLYNYSTGGGSIVVSLPSMPLGITGVSHMSFGCWDNRFLPHLGYAEIFCTSVGSCTTKKHEP